MIANARDGIEAQLLRCKIKRIRRRCMSLACGLEARAGKTKYAERRAAMLARAEAYRNIEFWIDEILRQNQ